MELQRAGADSDRQAIGTNEDAPVKWYIFRRPYREVERSDSTPII